MKFRHIATCALLGALVGGSASADENGCATLASATHSATPQAFQVRDGEPVDLISGMKTVHGKLLVFGEKRHVSRLLAARKQRRKVCSGECR